ncbi:DNA primase [Motilibacter aurantiacus]|uniref:DNA primase n=1 Tax=Motilibacter aurantiacus TaxID=2714955 RepID=UPI00140D7B9E|nr:DNA primase [Motilibacter aurantiacus]
MAGRIRDEDVALVKERVNIADVVGEHVTLRRAGADALKGLCPFHDEKTPSFNVRPSIGTYHCFGCNAGGDAIDFLRQLEQLSFAEAVERLAPRAGIELRYEDGSGPDAQVAGQRTRLLEAHRAAAEFYVEQLAGPEAIVGRRFLAERGFDRAAAEHFGVGYAPAGGEALLRHLRGRGFREDDLVEGGLVGRSGRGPYDRFRGRLIWPIRDSAGAVIGFGARRLHEDDRIQAKYLNTTETPIYKKSQVLYGIDLARREIAKSLQAVVVEGYTDVMACHLSGVGTAVATCGTAFGDAHARALRRYLMDENEFRGEVVFTFDGDEAGRKAALKAFEGDERFVTQTYVAVEPTGLDPCDLRLERGPEAVRELVSSRVPLFEFALRSAVGRYDMDTAEGRTAARRSGMSIVQRIRDTSLRQEYARRLAVLTSLQDPNELVAQARGSVSDARRAAAREAAPGPRPSRAFLVAEREALKAALQMPDVVGATFDVLPESAFTEPRHVAVARAITAAAGRVADAVPGPAWVGAVREAAADEEVRADVVTLAVEPLPTPPGTEKRYAVGILASVEEAALARRHSELLGRLQRLDPVAEADELGVVQRELMALDNQRRTVRDRALGAG